MKKSKEPEKRKVCRKLELCGIALLVIAFIILLIIVFLNIEIIPYKYLFLLLFLSVSLMLPDSIIDAVDEYKSDKPFNYYTYYTFKSVFGLSVGLIISFVIFLFIDA
jgi:hypothetical protein